jgi:hypothetical protein
MSEQDTIAVIGAGIVGAAVAYGNVGHIAAELVQPLPYPGLLFGFWRERFGGRTPKTRLIV